VSRRLKAALCSAIAGSGLDAFLGRVTGSLRRPWVVGYHAVVQDEHALEGLMPGLAITTATLEQHLDWIARRFDCVSLDDLRAGRPGRRPQAAITFDDGYRGVFEHAWPLLRRMGIPAALFIVSDRIGGATALLHDRLYRHLHSHGGGARSYALTRSLLHSLTPPEVAGLIERFGSSAPLAQELSLTWPMLRALREGGCTIGSHTRSHALLTATPPARLVTETAGSRSDLAEGLGSPVLHFAYPDGAFDRLAVEAVAEAGYLSAYTTCAHEDPHRPALTVPRTMLWEGSSTGADGRFSGAVLACQSSGLLERFSGCTIDHAAYARA
jgi:peptidoglycan/xylan/chitin deacetylase (PgdA/CDA1 family)